MDWYSWFNIINHLNNMGVQTTFDESLYNLKDNIKKAITECDTLLDPDVWGTDEYSNEYKERINKVRFKLVKMQLHLR